MKTKDSMVIEGFVTLTLKDKEGTILTTHSSNQIVYAGRHSVSKAIFGGTLAAGEKTVNTLRVAGGAVNLGGGGDPLDPTAPAATDDALFEVNPLKIVTVALDAPAFNASSSTSAPTATFTKTLSCADVDLYINEVGAYFGTTGPMFAHFTFPTLDLRAISGNSVIAQWQFVL